MRQHLNNNVKRYLFILLTVAISLVYLYWLRIRIGTVAADDENNTIYPVISKESISVLDRIFPIIEPPLPDVVSDDTISELQRQIPPNTCYKSVQKFESNRCGYYAIIADTSESGSESLWHTLMQNPVLKGVHRNEHRCNYDEAYSACISRLGEQAVVRPEEAQVLIGKGPNRLLCEDVVSSMHQSAPELKTVFLFEHPVNRLYNHWSRHVARRDRSYSTFHDWIEERTNLTQKCFDSISGTFFNCLLDESLCSSKLEPMVMSSSFDIIRLYELFYPREQLYVMISEEFFENPQRETDKLLKWLGLPTQRYESFNSTDIRRQPTEASDKATRETLWFNYYEKGVRRLEEYLGRDLPWTIE
eukprot:TRINITY_DN3596_c0_g1_i1.p1 TRINITY_DN3596_c0_g1~~TRINITY_DN3596_c0_g1_i1.p1  ORF type:complete len:360 (+),score=31.81 TRINITY_DN3596_c0_g1_i1:379-1458(+)